MRDVLGAMRERWTAGETVALATVVQTFDSAPRPAGAAMLVTCDGEAVGSLSGGCIEGAVYDLATQVIQDGVPQLVRYGISDEEGFAVGLTCGGTVDVFVEPVSQKKFAGLDLVHQDIDDSRPVGVATVIAHPDPRWLGRHLIVRPGSTSGDLGSERANRAASEDGQGLLAAGRNGTVSYGPDGQRQGEGMQIFYSSHAPRPRMIVFGAIDFAAALAQAGTFLGFRVTVCDARSTFATPARFPHAAEVVVAWPHEYLTAELAGGTVDARTVLCVLTHDPKFDVPLLEVALQSGTFAYIGAMGSRLTHDDRVARLRASGVTEPELSLLHSPIGLDLGARTPEETAISITAEIIARRWGGSGESLSSLADRIHRPPLD
jgi:xanthine dehydrogenase accessory factor